MSQLYQAHESFWSDFKMYFSMAIRAFFVGLLCQMLFMGLCLYKQPNPAFKDSTGIIVEMPKSVFVKYHTGFAGLITEKIAIEKELMPYANGWTELSVDQYRQFVDWLVDGEYSQQHDRIEKFFKWSFTTYLISVAYLLLFVCKSKGMTDEKFVRGAQLTPIKELTQKLNAAVKKNPHSTLKIGDITIPFDMESKHILILGSSGSGKGVLLNQIAAQITNRKLNKKMRDRMIFYDVKGEFVSKQFCEGDLIFYPFDARSIGWNIFNELEIMPDFDVISQSLFACSKEDDSYWYTAAGDVFRAGLVYLKMNNMTANRQIWEFFSQSTEVIKAALKTLPISEQGALKHIDQSDSPTSASVISILQTRIKFFYYLAEIDGNFSFRQYIRNQAEGVHPNLFILNIKGYEKLFKPLMTLVIDIMAREILSLPDDLNRRVFFIVDELGTLDKMESILAVETVGRSKGASLICSNQDLGLIEEKYGQAALKTFYNNFNTSFIFRIKEPKTQEFLSSAIGEQEKIKTAHSRQMSPSEVGDRKSISEQEKTERLVLASEFSDLPDLTAVVNISGYGISKIQVPKVYYQERLQSFIMCKFTAVNVLERAAGDNQELRIADRKQEVESSQPTSQGNFGKLRV